MPPEIAIIGGSGLYDLFENPQRTEQPSTPYGAPSGAITIAEVAGRSVAFLPRHGKDHRYPAHRINYRANLWALRGLGCRRILAPCAVGSLVASLDAGTLVLPDQLIDRTSGRGHTYYDEGAVHVNFADPFCPSLRRALLAVSPMPLVSSGTMVVVNGPRFSSRAESLDHAASGGTIINMTGAPEAPLARELALCYAPIALVTDHDAGLEDGHGVNQAEVFRVYTENTVRVRELLFACIAAFPDHVDCQCNHALDGMTLPFTLP
jgi:5'-methylthioadenosine phosphorylase